MHVFELELPEREALRRLVFSAGRAARELELVPTRRKRARRDLELRGGRARFEEKTPRTMVERKGPRATLRPIADHSDFRVPRESAEDEAYARPRRRRRDVGRAGRHFIGAPAR